MYSQYIYIYIYIIHIYILNNKNHGSACFNVKLIESKVFLINNMTKD